MNRLMCRDLKRLVWDSGLREQNNIKMCIRNFACVRVQKCGFILF